MAQTAFNCTCDEAATEDEATDAVFWLRVDPGLPVPGPPPPSAVSRVVGRSISLWIWMPSPGPMWLMWLKLLGAEISFDRRSGFLGHKKKSQFHENWPIYEQSCNSRNRIINLNSIKNFVMLCEVISLFMFHYSMVLRQSILT